MSENFGDAAQRHWHDAETLLKAARATNADPLYGFAAECSLKAVMQALAMTPNGLPKAYRVHIDKLWDMFRTFARRNGGLVYASSLLHANPFANWEASQRYWHSDSVKELQILEHRQGARLAMQVLSQARINGVV